LAGLHSYFCQNRIVLKNLFLFAVLLCLYVSCNTSSGKGKPEDDSLQYYPPTPGKLDKEDFRSYYRQLSSFFDTGLLKSGFNGGILIAKDGNIIYEKMILLPAILLFILLQPAKHLQPSLY